MSGSLVDLYVRTFGWALTIVFGFGLVYALVFAVVRADAYRRRRNVARRRRRRRKLLCLDEDA